MPFTDETIMPFGTHKGKKLANVPSRYLLWLGDEIDNKSKIHWTLTDKLLHEYITDNKKALENENTN